jgi:uncharacterized protein (TIGR02679 family)
MAASPARESPYRAAEYRRLLAAARRSLERHGGGLAGTVSISHPTDAERKAIIGITGQYRDLRTARLTVRLTDLDTAVREVTGHPLAELLAELGGPLRNRPAERDKLAAARTAAVRAAEASPLHAPCGWYRDWLAEITADGSLTKLVNQSGQAQLVQAVRLLERLAKRSGGGPVLLPALAADITGDTKALNRGTVLSTLVLRALAIRAGAGRPETAEDRRELWEANGVVVDDLASRVLVLNVAAQGRGLGEWLAGAAQLGVPFYVTLHQLMTMPLQVRGDLVHVCENPAVLRRAAAELGAASAPLLCTEGRPSTAFHRLAGAVTGSGGELRYHGDFDWPGIAITNSVISRHGARVWRMCSADYLAGVRAGAEYVPLAGTPQPTPWDPGLCRVMSATGSAVYEETVTDALISDLRGDGPVPDGAGDRK